MPTSTGLSTIVPIVTGSRTLDVAPVTEPDRTIHTDLPDLVARLTAAAGGGDLTGAVESVAEIAGCPVALLRPDRTLLAASELGGCPDGGGERARTLRWVSGSHQPGGELMITAGTRRLGVLVFRRPVCDNRVGPAMWSAVHDVLSLALLAREATERAEQAEQRAALLGCLTEGVARAPVPDGVRHRPAVLIGPDGSTPAPGAVPDHVRRRLAEEPLLAGGQFVELEDRAVYLYSEPDKRPRDQARAWCRVLDSLAPCRVRVVVGLPEAPGRGLRESYQTARWLSDLQLTPLPGMRLADVVMVDELGVVGGTIGPGWGRRLGHFVGRVLGDVVDNPRFGGEILDTLHAYLVSGRSPTEAARLLHLSPSSMKYRMRIIREALGEALDDHDTAFEIELALRLLKSFEALRDPGTAATPSSSRAAGRAACLVPGSH
jgi:hypothetical protein